MPSPLQEQIAKVQKKLAELKAKSAAAKTKQERYGKRMGPANTTRKKKTVDEPGMNMKKTKKIVPKQVGDKSGQPAWKQAGKLPPGLQGRELPPGLKDKGGPPGLLKPAKNEKDFLLKPAKPVKVQKEREEEKKKNQHSKRASGLAKKPVR